MPIEKAGPNSEQITYWNDTAGPKWVALQNFLDSQIRPLGLAAMERARLAEGEQVIDVGCGCGDTSLEIGRRVGSKGAVMGIDISTPMLERAQAMARDARLSNATFANADAQTASLPQKRFDLLFSRFGVMFFIDPAAAFANLRSAMKPGGRLTFVCWRTISDNPWVMVPLMAAMQHLPPLTPPAPGAPGPFAFAEKEHVENVLTRAGWTDVQLERLDQSLGIGVGSSLEQTVDFLMQMGPTANMVRDASPEVRGRVAAAMLEAVRPFDTPEGLRLSGSVWIVTARNP